MRVVHIGTADNSGGAARASFQLHLGLIRQGHESSMLVGRRTESRPEIERVGFSRTLLGKIFERAVLEAETLSGLQYLLQPLRYRFLQHRFVQTAEVIHLHNLHGNFFSFTILPELARIAPLVWTLHDTWALTGHCSYNYDCMRWESGCGQCPSLQEYPPIALDTTAMLWRKKLLSYQRAALSVVAPSQWLYEMAVRSPLLKGLQVSKIPYGIDLNEFSPDDQGTARDELALPRDARVIMIVAFDDQVVGADRKGAAYFKAAVRLLNLDRRAWILVVGSRGVFREFEHQFHIREVGYLDSSSAMRRCYVAADVFVSPTLADNLPVSLIEATACGTPSVTFRIGGTPDVVRHQETGYVAEYRQAEDLSAGIRWVLADESRLSRLRKRCREVAECEYSIDLEVARYVKLYGSVEEGGQGRNQASIAARSEPTTSDA